MLTDNEYYLGWLVYLLAVFGLGAVWWKITSFISIRTLQVVARVAFFAIMVPPAMLVDSSNRMAPAVMVALIELTIGEQESLDRVYVPFGATLFLGILLVFGEYFWRRKRQQAQNPLK